MASLVPLLYADAGAPLAAWKAAQREDRLPGVAAVASAAGPLRKIALLKVVTVECIVELCEADAALRKWRFAPTCIMNAASAALVANDRHSRSTCVAQTESTPCTKLTNCVAAASSLSSRTTLSSVRRRHRCHESRKLCATAASRDVCTSSASFRRCDIRVRHVCHARWRVQR